MREIFEKANSIFHRQIESAGYLKAGIFSLSMIFLAAVIQYARGLILEYQGYHEGREYIEVGFGIIDPVTFTVHMFLGFLTALAVIYILSSRFDAIKFSNVFNAFSYATVVGPIVSLVFNLIFFGMRAYPLIREFYLALFLTILVSYFLFLYIAYRGMKSVEIPGLDSVIVTTIFSGLWFLAVLLVMRLSFLIL